MMSKNMIMLTPAGLRALSEVANASGGYGPHKIGLEEVSTVNLLGGETMLGEGLLVVTLFYDDQRDGEYHTRYLIGSSLTGGKALQLK